MSPSKDVIEVVKLKKEFKISATIKSFRSKERVSMGHAFKLLERSDHEHTIIYLFIFLMR